MFSLSVPRFLALGAAAALAAGCLDAADSADLSADELAATTRDSHQRPTDHGALTLPAREEFRLTDEQRFHAWQLDITGDAELTIGTGPWLTDRRMVDTWVYLYKLGPNGWGSY